MPKSKQEKGRRTRYQRKTDMPSQRKLHLRIMAESEGWLLVRFTGCSPFAIHRTAFDRDYEPTEAQ